MILPDFYVDDIIKRALEEDINYADLSSVYLFSEDDRSSAYFVAKAEGTVCGVDASMRVFELLDATFEKTVHITDGSRVRKGDVICEFSGKTLKLLAGERTSLNLIQHMSGIATAAAEICSLVEGTKASIADTRKTLPGLRALQKYAVTCGGASNHRFNLSDAVMLKDNHVDAGGGIIPCVRKVRAKIGHTVKIEVETRDLGEVAQALEAGADIIMLDNMSLEDMEKAVELIDGRALSEASGNVTKENVALVAKTGVDIISIGALTHSVRAFDISMKVSR